MNAIPGLIQRSPEWFEVRLSRPTASIAGEIVTPARLTLSASRKNLTHSLIAMRYLNIPQDEEEKAYYFSEGGQYEHDIQIHLGKKFFGNIFTNHGNEFEDEARHDFQETTGIKLKEVGFIVGDCGFYGLSPDGTEGTAEEINARGLRYGYEGKCLTLKNHIAIIDSGEVPLAHVAQVQFSLAVSGAEVWYFNSYFPGYGSKIIEVKADDKTERVRDNLATYKAEYIETHKRIVPVLNGEVEGGSQ